MGRLIVLYNLVYQGEVLGYRIFLENKAEEYDITQKDLALVLEDLAITVEQPNINDIDLKKVGTNLVPVGLRDVEFISYGDLCELYGYTKYKKMDSSLKLLYNELNLKYFNNELPKDVLIYWSNSMLKHTGTCKLVDDITITLASSYHLNFPDELINMLMHEMIHLKLNNTKHDALFIEEVNKFNETFGLGITINPLKYKGVNYLYECPVCKSDYPTEKKLNLSATRCSKCLNILYLKEDLTMLEEGY